jgi:predicted nucleotidyltransferase
VLVLLREKQPHVGDRAHGWWLGLGRPLRLCLPETEKKEFGPRGGAHEGLDVEIVGRDVRSMAKLALKNDVNVLECVLTPLVYSGRGSQALHGLKLFVEEHYSWEHCATHYGGWAKNHYVLLKADPQKPKGKKKKRETNRFEKRMLKV